jgi:hypothetical protein
LQAPEEVVATDNTERRSDDTKAKEEHGKFLANVCDVSGAPQAAETNVPLSEKAEKLEKFMKLVLWITFGVPLLNRIVLQKAIRARRERSWADLSLKEIEEKFIAKDSSLAEAVRNNERSLKEMQFSELREVEKVQLLLQAALRVETTLRGKDSLADAVVKALVYTRPPL